MKSSTGNRLVGSLAWMSLASIGAKVAALVTQVAVGFYLTSTEVGIAALASAIFAIVSPMGEQGVQKLLIVNRGLDHDISPAVRRIAFAIQLATAVVFVVIAGFLIEYDRRDEAIVLLLHLPVLFSLASVGMARARLQITGAFRKIANAMAYGALSKAVFMIALLLAGASFYAFPISLLLSKLLEFALLRHGAAGAASSDVRKPETLDSGTYRRIRKATLWIALGTFSAAMVNNADYLALGMIANVTIMGQYFFGYQSVTAVSTIVAAGFGTVMLPAFTIDDHDQRLALLGASLNSVLLIASPLFIAAALLMPWLFSMVWGTKWVEASWVAALMLLALTTRMFGPLLRSFLEAQQRWRMQAFLSLGDGAMMFGVSVVAALLFAESGHATLWFALMVALYRWTYGFILIVLTVTRLKAVASAQIPAFVVFGISTLGGAGMTAWIIGSSATTIVPAIAFVAGYALLVLVQPTMRQWYLNLFTKLQR